MKTVFVSGRMHVLFNVHEIVLNQEADIRIRSYSCKWCGWRRSSTSRPSSRPRGQDRRERRRSRRDLGEPRS
jgi:hypothetical protein